MWNVEVKSDNKGRLHARVEKRRGERGESNGATVEWWWES